MIKKIFRPFWSIDIIKTEKWLQEMSTKGYQLKKVNFKISKFTFEKSNCNPITYRICRNALENSDCSPSLKRDGWINIFSKGKWSILGNYNNIDFIKLTPSRDGILRRNNILKYILSIPSIIYLFSLISNMITLQIIFSELNIDTTNNPFLLTQTIITTLIFSIPISLILLAIKINNCSKALENENSFNSISTSKNNFNCSENFIEEIKKKRLILKFKLAWTFSPDKFASWLENMELQGYNLDHIGFLGLFIYFTKGSSRKIKYFVDFQGNTSNDYFEINELSGWKMCFKTKFCFPKHIVWSKKYIDKEPNFYSDSYTLLTNVKKQSFLYGGMYLICLLLWLFIFIISLKSALEFNDLFNIKYLLIQFILILELSYFLIKSITYYLRVKKSIKSNI